MRQAGVFACLIIRGLCLVVELQRKLDVPRRLGTINLSYVGAKAHIGRVKLYVVKRVDKLGSELQFEPFRELEVLMQTHVHIGVVWPTDPGELRSAVTEGSNRRVGEVAVVGEPLVATDSWEGGLVDGSCSSNRREAIAISTRTAG